MSAQLNIKSILSLCWRNVGKNCGC